MKASNLSALAILLVACGGSDPSEDLKQVPLTGIAACQLRNGKTAIVSYDDGNMCWESDGSATPPVQLTSSYFQAIRSDGPCDRTSSSITGCCTYQNVVFFAYGDFYESCGYNDTTGIWHRVP